MKCKDRKVRVRLFAWSRVSYGKAGRRCEGCGASSRPWRPLQLEKGEDSIVAEWPEGGTEQGVGGQAAGRAGCASVEEVWEPHRG